MYLWLHFNFMTRKPIQMVQITYFDSMKTSQPKIIRFVNFFFEMVKKIYDASHVYFLVLSPWLFWSLFDINLHLRLKLINLGNSKCSFDVGEAAILPTPDITLIRVKWEKFNCQNLTKFFTKIGFFELLFFYIFVNISSFGQHIWACSTLFFAYKYQGYTEFKPVLIN